MSYEYIKEAANALPITCTMDCYEGGIVIRKVWRDQKDKLHQLQRIVGWVEIETCRINPILGAIEYVSKGSTPQ